MPKRKLPKKINARMKVALGLFAGVCIGIILGDVLQENSIQAKGIEQMVPVEICQSNGKNILLEMIESKDFDTGTDQSEEMGIKNDSDESIDVVSPDTASGDFKELTGANVFRPKDDKNSMLESIASDLSESDYEHIAENKETWKAKIDDYLRIRINQESQPDKEKVNRDKNFTSKTVKACQIEDDLKVNGMDVEKLYEIIQIREAADDIYSIKDLSQLLGNNYSEYGRLMKTHEKADWQKAYDSYLQSIKYDVKCIRFLPEVDDEYYQYMYKIGMTLQSIGDMSTIDLEYKKEAYFLSACCLEVATSNNFELENDSYGFKSNYYAAMVNHKLFLITWDKRNRDSQYYLMDAYGYYKKSLEFKKYQKQLNYQYQYIEQICNCGKEYIECYGRGENMPTKEEFEKERKKYEQLRCPTQ